MNDFVNVLERAKVAIQKGIATVRVEEDPNVVSDLDFEGPGKGKPFEISTGMHSVELIIKWREMQP